MSEELPPTRWELGETAGYGARFAKLIADGADVEGEARLADVLVGRGARILDAGAGMGRIGAALQARGHLVVAAEKDPALVADAAARYPGLAMVETDLLALTPESMTAAGHPASYDLIVLVGNVIVLLAPETERRLLTGLRGLLADGGRILVGFHPAGGHGSARDYPVEEFVADVEASGLVVQHRFGTYELGAPSDDYCVAVLAPSGSR
ncbi:methyltransferase domain-containing protein [Nocardioides marmoriginsengisoli]|uniref:Methyltransferase domain-containing protein n=1 Tax=Nocardioides marmoriginsengisoli TaxID=661483 RepID=A0A3N0CD98_9ACTN|nr:methyltransferase [Nocardioides marmoriginsengisoli]RNL61211.1 methyltransferase domain-containing protein [Nocardioides marmoriginsengisoli]